MFKWVKGDFRIVKILLSSIKLNHLSIATVEKLDFSKLDVEIFHEIKYLIQQVFYRLNFNA